jgi:hypothetical protein
MADESTATVANSRRGGRPARPEGPVPQAVYQKRYRARLKEKARLVPDLATFVQIRDDLRAALVKLQLRAEDVQRQCHLETELKRLEQHHTDALKEIVLLKRALAEPRPVTAGQRP